jgi:hypothetical protein
VFILGGVAVGRYLVQGVLWGVLRCKEYPSTLKRGDAVAPGGRMGWMGIEIKGSGNTVCLENSALYVADLEP